jgi:hypothetical protein
VARMGHNRALGAPSGVNADSDTYVGHSAALGAGAVPSAQL